MSFAKSRNIKIYADVLVLTLIYDVQKFQNNIDPYFMNLCRHLVIFCTVFRKASFQHADKEIEALLSMAKSCFYPVTSDPFRNAAGQLRVSTCRIVQRGLELYSKKAEEQSRYNNSGELLACLCVGLMRLTNVDKVEFQTDWTDKHLRSIDWTKNARKLRLSSSPLARTWSPFHLQATLRQI